MKKTLLLMLGVMLAAVGCSESKKAAELTLLSPGKGMHSNWVAESHSPKLVTTVTDNSMEIVAPKGVTLWYDKSLKGDYQISYRVKFIMEGGEFDRLSDLNCFWGARDPEYPKDIYERSIWRNGEFEKYNTLDLFYVGYGGNHNSTSRFREYRAEYADQGRDAVKPVIKEYTDKENLLKPNQWMTIVITVKDGLTTYSMDGAEIFSLEIPEGRGDGYFGLRLLQNHTIFEDFSITEL